MQVCGTCGGTGGGGGAGGMEGGSGCAGGVGGITGGDGIRGGSGGIGASLLSRGPQLMQSVPKAHASYSAPTPPSSQSLSEAWMHVSAHSTGA